MVSLYVQKLENDLVNRIVDQNKELELKKLNYYYLKIRYFIHVRDAEQARKFLYKMDLFIRNKFNNDINYRT